MSGDGYLPWEKGEMRKGLAMVEKQPGLNGDSQRAASLSTAVEGRAERTGDGQEVQVQGGQVFEYGLNRSPGVF